MRQLELLVPGMAPCSVLSESLLKSLCQDNAGKLYMQGMGTLSITFGEGGGDDAVD